MPPPRRRRFSCEADFFRFSQIFLKILLTNGNGCAIISPVGRTNTLTEKRRHKAMRKWRNWQTRTFEGRVGIPIRVQVPFSASKPESDRKIGSGFLLLFAQYVCRYRRFLGLAAFSRSVKNWKREILCRLGMLFCLRAYTTSIQTARLA